MYFFMAEQDLMRSSRFTLRGILTLGEINHTVVIRDFRFRCIWTLSGRLRSPRETSPAFIRQ